MLGFDVLEMRDHLGNKYSVMSMVDIATGFHMCEVVKEGGGQPNLRGMCKGIDDQVDCLGWLAKGMYHGSSLTTEAQCPRC